MKGLRQTNRMGRGFTLVEVLIAAMLVAIVIGMLLIPIVNSIGYFRAATARGDAQNVARNALDTMAGELSEAAYVWQDMDDNTLLAFAPPLRVDPSDPNSQIVTPPRPDWDHAVRYWRALHNPTYNYSAGTTLSQPNPYFLARTVVEHPSEEDDAWNTGDDPRHNRNRAWADLMNNPNTPGYQAGVNWSPITRIVHTDVDRKWGGGVGYRDKTLQPGYPYLEMTWNPSDHPEGPVRFYRDSVVGLTPNSVDYSVPQLQFEPMIVSGEWLTPGPDHSTYLAHYPLWRLGVPYTSWTALQGENPVFPDPTVLDQVKDWVRDPFLVIYRYGAGVPGVSVGQYAPIGIGCFDWRSRTMKVINPHVYTGMPIYDTYDYPARSWDPLKAVDIAFDVDWVNGAMRFDFPPYHAELTPPRTDDQPVVVEGKALKEGPGGPLDYPLPLASPEWWETRVGGTALYHFLLPDSVSVRLDSNGDGRPDRALQRVHRTPRDYSDEFQVGLDPVANGDATQPKYGYIRLPAHLSLWVSKQIDGKPTRVWIATKDIPTFWIYYRWRSNGVVPAGLGLDGEKPDLVSAYYRTASVIDINLTVARTGPRGSQAAHMTRRVKLQNVIREIREGK